MIQEINVSHDYVTQKTRPEIENEKYKTMIVECVKMRRKVTEILRGYGEERE